MPTFGGRRSDRLVAAAGAGPDEHMSKETETNPSPAPFSQPPRVLIAIPAFNNHETLRGIAEKALATGLPVLVVNDGSTDGSADTLEGLPIQRIDFPENQGKGAAILAAGAWAKERGFTHIITLDADGQHDPADAPLFLPRIQDKPWAILIGCRDFDAGQAPGSSRFGRHFSNFWLHVATGVRVPDSQSGFRAYPVESLTGIPYHSKRYDFEIEVLVRSIWAGLGVDSVDISVAYPDERVSHFDKVRDNARISRMYTRSVLRALTPWPHKILFHTPVSADSISLRHPIRAIRILLLERTRPREIAFACTLGVFIATLPIFGFHSPLIIFFATLLRLNRVIAFNVQHLCMPPVVPVLCIQAGHFMRTGRFLTQLNTQTLWHEALYRLWEWVLGSLALAPVLAILVGLVAYLLARFYQHLLARARQAAGKGSA